ncbi:hypothetical protein NHQ30_002789 [Ciborinia camelliae]|nr:hypothetical protein NHQ30_002789 [Ciborinia camelliae]
MERITIAIRPIRDDEPANDRGRIPGRDIAIEIREAGEENRRVEEVEFGLGEASMQHVDDGGEEGAHDEGVGQGAEDGEFEEAAWSDEHVLRAGGEGGGETLPRPLVRGVGFRPAQICGFGTQHPFDDGVVDGDPDETSKGLREKCVARRNVHVVADLLVLEHELRAVPGVACDG